MFQMCAITVYTKSYETSVASIYCPPKYILRQEAFEDAFEQMGNRFIIGGDFNAKNTVWGSRITNGRGRELYQYITSHKCEAYSTGKPTYWPTDTAKKPDLIDFFVIRNISANYLLVDDCYDLSSDHSPIILTLSEQVIQKTHNPVLTNHKTDWDKFKIEINRHVNLNDVLDTPASVDGELEKLVHAIQTVAWECTPEIRKKLKGINYPSEIIAAIKTKRKARKKWQSTQVPALKTAWHKTAGKLRELMLEIQEATNEHYITTLTSDRDTDYSLWKATKHLKRPIVQAPPIKDAATGKWVKCNQEKADAFACHLANIFTPNPADPNDELLEEPQLCDLEIGIPLVTVKEVQRTIWTEINPKKAPGYDLITGQVLKQLPRKVLVKVTKIINAAFKLRYVPQLWKLAEVIMVPKPGKPVEELTSYRPISLLPVLSKLFEKLLHKRLMKIVEDRNLVPAHQFGFRQKHSTIDQVHRITSIIEKALEERKVCSAIFLDVTQAFDKVWHEGLNHKLRKMLPAQYAELLESYLTDRYFRIKQDDAYSEAKKIQAGVPQGSVLGPLLYVLYTSDLPEREENTTATFADDTAILAVGNDNHESISKLRRSISRLQDWTAKWRIKMNEAKSVHVDFTNRRISYIPIHLNSKVIPYANEAKYLGMTLDAKLRWKAHVKKKKEELVLKFRKMYWLMGRRSKMSIQNKLTLYNQVLKPVWTYGAQLWGCTAQSNRDIIQRFQNNVLRCCVDAYRYTRNVRLHIELQVDPVNEVIKNKPSPIISG
uniref:Putative RNA-directed DNA polymerase from transposon X-element n=2 Tax=Lygus hesperus TaxID=30085 RepID=A0A0A9YSX4_LYGHE